jgi:hypothetical protein
MEKDYNAARCAAGKGSAVGAARVKGAILSRERMAPLDPQENGECPSTPDIGSLDLEELLSLRNRVRCTWLRHESLRFVTTLNRALLS